MKTLVYLLCWAIGRVDKTFVDLWLGYSDYRYRRAQRKAKAWRGR